MIGWIILAVYIVGWLGFSAVIARFIASGYGIGPDSDAFDKVGMSILGMLLAFFWPLVVPGAWVYKRVWIGKGKAD